MQATWDFGQNTGWWQGGGAGFRRSHALSLCLACLLGVASARAEPVEEAREQAVQDEARRLFEEGIELSREQRWSEAEGVFRRSHRLVPRSSTAFNLALALLHLERGKEALEVLTEVQELAPAEERDAYAEELDLMRKRADALAGRLDMRVSPEGAALTIDGEPAPGSGPMYRVVLDPGAHRITVSAENHQAESLEVVIAPGERMIRSVFLERERKVLRAPPSHAAEFPAPEAYRMQPADDGREEGRGSPEWLPYGLLGTGAVAIAAAGVTGFIALDAKNEFDDVCPDRNACADRERAEPLEDKTHDFALASDVLWISGAVAAGAGLVLLWTSGESDETRRASAQVSIGANRATFRARW